MPLKEEKGIVLDAITSASEIIDGYTTEKL